MLLPNHQNVKEETCNKEGVLTGIVAYGSGD